MSFRDLESGRQGCVSRHHPQPKQRRDEESPFERVIKANIQEMQDNMRLATEQLGRATRSFLSKRMAEALDRYLERSRDLAEEAEQSFRDWTVHLAGEPSERHRKKFSYDKLRKAFEEEVVHLKDVARQVMAAQQEARNTSGSAAIGMAPMCEEQSSNDDVASDDDGQGLLDDAGRAQVPRCHQLAEDTSIQSRIAMEREEGIRRIQSQVSEVNQIFRDLASICTDQGQHIETIEAQAESTVLNTKQATQELKKASDRQRSTRERLCCMLTVGVVVLLFVVMYHAHALGFSRPVQMANVNTVSAVGDSPVANAYASQVKVPDLGEAEGAPAKSWGFEMGTRVISKTGPTLS